MVRRSQRVFATNSPPPPAAAAPVDCAKLNAVPASIADIVNDFFALLRGDLRRATIYSLMSNSI